LKQAIQILKKLEFIAQKGFIKIEKIHKDAKQIYFIFHNFFKKLRNFLKSEKFGNLIQHQSFHTYCWGL
jgi:hypothetical protein